MSQALKIIQWNLRSFKHKCNELINYSRYTDIFIISETRLDFRDSITFKGFDIIRKDRIDRRGGGVLILVRSNLKYLILEDIPDCQGRLETCGITIFSDQGKISIISLYRPPDSPQINSLMWSNFFSYFQGNFVIGGDFNLSHDQILSLQESILDLDIILLNDDTYWNEERNYSSILDLSFINSSLGLKSSWSVNQDPWGSDHFPIFININANTTLKSKANHSPKLHSSKTDWANFSENLESDVINYSCELSNISDIQTLYSSFTSLIVKNISNATTLSPLSLLS